MVILSHFPDMDITLGKGDFPNPNSRGLSNFFFFFYNISCFCYESLLHIPLHCGHTVCLVPPGLCETRPYKENFSWQLVPQDGPSIPTNTLTLLWDKCLGDSKPCNSFLEAVISPLSLYLFLLLLSFHSLAHFSRVGSWMLYKVLHTHYHSRTAQ